MFSLIFLKGICFLESTEFNMELLSHMSAFSPSNSFTSFNAQKLCRLADFYPKEFSNNNLLNLNCTYIIILMT